MCVSCWWYGTARQRFSWIARAFLAAALRLQRLPQTWHLPPWLNPRYPVRVSLSSRCSCWPGNIGWPHLTQGLPYALGNRALRSFWCWLPYPAAVVFTPRLPAHAITQPSRCYLQPILTNDAGAASSESDAAPSQPASQAAHKPDSKCADRHAYAHFRTFPRTMAQYRCIITRLVYRIVALGPHLGEGELFGCRSTRCPQKKRASY